MAFSPGKLPLNLPDTLRAGSALFEFKPDISELEARENGIFTHRYCKPDCAGAQESHALSPPLKVLCNLHAVHLTEFSCPPSNPTLKNTEEIKNVNFILYLPLR